MPRCHAHWLQSSFGLPTPILQAPMAAAQDHRLAVAVARAGGLGALASATLTPETLRTEIERFRAAVAAPLNVNFFCHTPTVAEDSELQRWESALAPFYAELEQPPPFIPRGAGRQPFSADWLPVLTATRPEVVSFHFGLPAPKLLEAVRQTGARVLSSATTVAEARWLDAMGVDAIIVQGWEAGGHRGHFLSQDLGAQSGTLALLQQVVQATNKPVVAAGGVATPQAVRACRSLGAQAVQVGTAYLLAPEALTHPVHRKALADAGSRTTAVTRLFTGRPARGLVNRLMHTLGPMNPDAPPFPWAAAALVPLRERAERLNLDDFTPLWAGQAASLARALPAQAITEWLAEGWSDTDTAQSVLD